MTIADLYQNSVKSLPTFERLRLAAMILNDIAATDSRPIDESESWSDEDLSDFANGSWSQIERRLVEEAHA